ncbi:MAG: hypothetical protein HOP29_19355 [Phycisphaerales bacterium]|nr:hypothetical protein [Phycisphaerales bacterium]
MSGRKSRLALALLAFGFSTFAASRVSYSQDAGLAPACIELEILLYYGAYALLDGCEGGSNTCQRVWDVINDLQCGITSCWNTADGVCSATDEP